MKNIIFEIRVRADESLEYHLIYIQGRKVHGKRRNKTWPKVTQCLVFRNGLFSSCGEVVKCDDDLDNTYFAVTLATKKAIKEIPFKDIRVKIWEELNTIVSHAKK